MSVNTSNEEKQRLKLQRKETEVSFKVFKLSDAFRMEHVLLDTRLPS